MTQTATLRQEDINRYAEITARLRQLEEERDRLRSHIIESFNAGQPCPRNGPFLVVMGSITRHTFSWKDILAAVLGAMPERFRKKYDRISAEMYAKTEETPVLRVQTNPDWRA